METLHRTFRDQWSRGVIGLAQTRARFIGQRELQDVVT